VIERIPFAYVYKESPATAAMLVVGG